MSDHALDELAMGHHDDVPSIEDTLRARLKKLEELLGWWSKDQNRDCNPSVCTRKDGCVHDATRVALGHQK